VCSLPVFVRIKVGVIELTRINLMAAITLKTISKMIVNVEKRIVDNQKALTKKLDVLDLRVQVLTDLVKKLEGKLMAKIDDVIAAVAEETTVIASVGVLLDRLTAEIADLKEDAADGRVEAEKVDALYESVKANSDILRAAVVKNTPEEGSVDEHGLTM
jgi:uncharacterized coiled-coil protein SlyX